MSKLRNIVESKSVGVIAGSGGVGKTTVAAAVALNAALQSNRRVLAITVDPARRLADALGVSNIGDAPTRIDIESIAGKTGTGELWVSMLDTKKAWDELVRHHAPNKRTADAILSNKLYENISGRFVQSHDYIAMERLYELHESGEYDLIIVDTPPSSHAADLLDAPKRLGEFFDSRLLKFLVAPSKSRFASITARPFLQLADRLLGKRFLSDISEFFTLLESMRPGFISRSEKVAALLASSECTFVAVTTLEPTAVHEAESLIAALVQRDLELGAVVANRVLPDYLSSLDAGALEAKARSLSDDSSASHVIEELLANSRRMGQLAMMQAKQSEHLAGRAKILTRIPWLEGELRSLEGLSVLGEMIW